MGKKKNLENWIEGKYRIGTWDKFPNYECLLCPYSTLDEEAMVRHLTLVHAPPPEPQAETKTPRYDRFGNLIEEE